MLNVSDLTTDCTGSGIVPKPLLGLSLTYTATEDICCTSNQFPATETCSNKEKLPQKWPPTMLVCSHKDDTMSKFPTSDLAQDFPGVDNLLKDMSTILNAGEPSNGKRDFKLNWSKPAAVTTTAADGNKSCVIPLLTAPNPQYRQLSGPLKRTAIPVGAITVAPDKKQQQSVTVPLPDIPLRKFVPQLVNPKEVIAGGGATSCCPLLLQMNDPLTKMKKEGLKLLVLPPSCFKQRAVYPADGEISLTTLNEPPRSVTQRRGASNWEKTTPISKCSCACSQCVPPCSEQVTTDHVRSNHHDTNDQLMSEEGVDASLVTVNSGFNVSRSSHSLPVPDPPTSLALDTPTSHILSPDPPPSQPVPSSDPPTSSHVQSPAPPPSHTPAPPPSHTPDPPMSQQQSVGVQVNFPNDVAVQVDPSELQSTNDNHHNSNTVSTDNHTPIPTDHHTPCHASVPIAHNYLTVADTDTCTVNPSPSLYELYFHQLVTIINKLFCKKNCFFCSFLSE